MSESQLIRLIDTITRLRQAGKLTAEQSVGLLHGLAAWVARQKEVRDQWRSTCAVSSRWFGITRKQSVTQWRERAMRILANYGYKANGDMYSVTFETMGDVPSTQASQTVDELFRLAKEAVQRQLANVRPSTQPATTVTVPQPAATQPSAQTSGNGLSAVPGTAQAGKRPQIKDPTLPATPRQLGLLRRLARQKGRRFDDFTDMTMGEASEKIEELMAL